MDKKKSPNQLKKGDVLRGQFAIYVISESLEPGGYGETYKATVRKVQNEARDRIDREQEFVIKIPRLDPSQPMGEKIKRVLDIIETLINQWIAAQRINELVCVAKVLDYGWYNYLLDQKRGISAPAPFLVQEFIEGTPLDQYMKSTYPSKDGEFHGLVKADDYFRWSQLITQSLLQIHQRLIVHGDIWYKNMMVRSDRTPVYIDFGQAIFRDLAFGPVGTLKGTHPFMAPEGGGSVEADIFSLGGVLLYLATGENPPVPVEDIDELKLKIADMIKQFNPGLYEENSGIVDIITRCLRYSRHGRTPNAEGVLQDIETFSLRPSFEDNTENLKTAFNCLTKENNPMFRWMADLKIRELCHDIEDMTHAVYELTGDHETIVSGLTGYLSYLKRGDQYLTISIPSFWHTRNMGINGRFLAMNKLCAQRGAGIRRIFLLTDDDTKSDFELQKIVDSHIRIMNELKEGGVQTTERNLRAGGYYTGYVTLTSQEREDLIKEGKHFGLLITKGGKEILIIPIYREDGVVVTVQFRANSDRIGELRENFNNLLDSSIPLPKYTYA